MQDQMQAQSKETAALTFGQRAGVFVSSSAVLLGAEAFIHAPLPLEIAAIVGAFCLAKKSPEIYAALRQQASFLPDLSKQEQNLARRARTGEWTVTDRLMGRHYNYVPEKEAQPKDGRDEAKPQQPNAPQDVREIPFYNPVIHRDHFFFGETLFPHADRILSGRKAIFGVSDAGKSNNIAVIWEELGRMGLQFEELCIPQIYFDSEDEARGLCSRKYVRNPRWMDMKSLTVQNAFAFAQQIMSERLQVVINLQSYEDVDAALVMFYMIRGIQHWEEALPNEDRIPCEIILDEAAVWLPQSSNESSLSKAIIEDPEGQPDDEGKVQPVSVLALLHRVFFSMVVRRGRKRGIGFTLATQRIAEIDKRALQANFLVLMRQTMTADFAVYKKYGIEPNEAAALKPGEAYIFSSQETKALHQFRRRNSPSGAKTPGLENLRKGRRHPIELEEEDAIEDIIAGMPEIDPDDSRDDGQSLWSTMNYRLPGVVRAPAYEQTMYTYNAQLPVNPTFTEASHIYRNGNRERSVNGSVNYVVNGPASRFTQQEHAPNLHLPTQNVNTSVERKKEPGAFDDVNVNPDTKGVSAEKREMIRRVYEMGIMTHAQIAKAAKLDGRNYPIYRQVCAEEGIEIK